MTTPRTINYKFSNLQEAVKCYHKSLERLESWSKKYTMYDFNIKLITTGHREPTVQIEIYKHK